MLRCFFAILLSCSALFAQQAQTPPQTSAQTAPQTADELEAVVTTDLGTFRFEFAPDKAPKHVAQFIKLAREGYYNGSAFFRLFANGMIQGGDPLLKDPKTPRALWGTGGLNMIGSEFSDLKHERGVVSTVSIPGKANSEGAQFFVCVGPQPPLDGKYTTFGRVTEGIKVVEAISRVPVDANQMAEKPVRILKVTIEPKKHEPFLNTPVSELHRTVTMKTSIGTMKIEMHPEWAPENVRNFLKLVSTGWYNGTSFHRVVKGFVAQGGAEDSRAAGAEAPPAADRWVHNIKGEFNFAVMHERGIVSMARLGNDPDSASTSFFIVLATSPNLDGQYSAFAKVIDGLDVLEKFDNMPVNGEKPVERVEILDATIDPQ